VPIRLYNAKLHMNRLGIGMDMANIFLPQIKLLTNNHANYVQTFDDNEHINPSCLLKYLGISGLGTISGATNPAIRYFNAVPLLAVADIYKNYYANKQEEIGYFIHTTDAILETSMTPRIARLFDENDNLIGSVLGGAGKPLNPTDILKIYYPTTAVEPDMELIECTFDGGISGLGSIFDTLSWDENFKIVTATNASGSAGETFILTAEASPILGGNTQHFALYNLIGTSNTSHCNL